MFRRASALANAAILIGVVSLNSFGAEIATVHVGNPDNAPDTTTFQYGTVGYEYRIGATEVTNSQYIGFLNSKASVGDALGFYNTNMASNAYGGILRSGSGTSLDPYTYAAKDGKLNHPVNFVSWYDAIRYANWMHNGQGNGDTETGSYNLGQLNANGTPLLIFSASQRTSDAKWFLPSINEWYKAAFHKNDGVTGNYWDYPVRSDNPPIAEAPAGGIHSANFDDAVDGPVEVASYSRARSAYGTFDQGGNLFEWVESTRVATTPATALVVGGHWAASDTFLSSSYTGTDSGKTNEFDGRGFRLATNVPEPGNWLLCLCSVVASVRMRRLFRPAQKSLDARKNYANSGTNPACSKCRSAVSASVMPWSCITTKEMQSVSDQFLSGRLS